MTDVPIAVERVNHHYGEGELRRQVLFDVSAQIRRGEMVILTGPSGSGKTTLLTLIGALRSTQEGSLRVLGHELRGASEATLAGIRRRIGYVFQAHNLLDSLTIRQNVQMSLQLHPGLSGAEVVQRPLAALAAVGLGERAQAHPHELSGGQRQRVAIARALVARPEIILADEPTASLDRSTGRGIVELLEKLARQENVTVVLVTHDSRILDVADRILALEDGRLSSLLARAALDTRRLMQTLARDIRKGELAARLEGLDDEAFASLLEEVTAETQQFLDVMEVAQSETFESMLHQVVAAFTAKLRSLLAADQVALYFLDPAARELWSYAACEHGEAREVRLSAEHGLLGEALRTGHVASASGPVLAAPVVDSEGRAFAVLELARAGAPAFAEADQEGLARFTRPLGLLLESWWRMSCACHKAGVGRAPACGCASPVSPANADPS